MEPRIETERFIRISTGHVSRKTAQILDDTEPAKWPCIGGSYADYGWFVHAYEENCGAGDQRSPDDLFAVMIWARKIGVEYVLLDCDGDRIDELEWFDW